MGFAKCIKEIKDIKGNTFAYIIKHADGKEETLSKEQLIKQIQSNKVYLINTTILNNDLDEFVITPANCLSDIRYHWDLASKNPLSHKYEKMYQKSLVLGMCPVNNGTRIIEGGTFDKIVITDKTNEINGNIKAEEITFVGDYILINRSNNTVRIRCKKANILNKCVYPNIIPDIANNNLRDVLIEANNIFIQHGYIDIYTVNEIFMLYKYLYQFYSEVSESAWSVINIDFKFVDISTKEVLEATIKITDRVFERYIRTQVSNGYKVSFIVQGEQANVIAAMHLACSMFISTRYKENKFIALADRLNMYLAKDLAVKTSPAYTRLKWLFKILQEECKVD